VYIFIIKRTSQVGDGFNVTLAQMQLSEHSAYYVQYRLIFLLDAPESTANPKATGTTLPSGLPGASSPKKSNAGAIAGGVVGGVVLLSLVGLTAFWFLRQRRKRAAPSTLMHTPMGYHSGEITPFSSAIQTPKLYVSVFHHEVCIDPLNSR
jgi:hypothetical protein